MGNTSFLKKSGFLPALFALVFFQACGRIVVSDDCPCGFYTIAGTDKKLTWKDGEEIHFRFQKDFPPVYRLAVEESVRTYNSVLEKTQIRIDQVRRSDGTLVSSVDAPKLGSDPSSVAGDGENGIYWIKGTWPWEKSDPDSAAMTLVQFSPEGIIEADVFFRDESYGRSPSSLADALELFSLGNGFQIDRADNPTKWVYVLGVHEFGHVLGRTHNGINGSVMNAAVGLAHVSEPFSQRDLDVLSSVYSLR